jgi:hypothetical protein
MLLQMDNSTYNRFPATVDDRLLDEGILSVVEAAKAENIQISAKTAIRWCLAGVRGARLEAGGAEGRGRVEKQPRRYPPIRCREPAAAIHGRADDDRRRCGASARCTGPRSA